MKPSLHALSEWIRNNIFMTGKHRRRPLFLLACIFLLLTVGISEADFQGTIGTRFTISGSGFGTKKPAVYVEYEKRPGVLKKVNARVEEWSDTSVSCLWTKQLPSGTYDLWIKPNIKGAAPLSEGTFSTMNPVIDEVTPTTLSVGETITLSGQFFTNSKPTVYLKDLESLKKRKCRVLDSAMDPATGASTLHFIAPEWASNNYEIVLQTRVGETSFTYPLEPLNHWYLRNPSPVDFPFVNKVAFAKGLFVSVGSGIHTSPDGINWTKRSSDNTLEDITYGNGIFVAVGFTGAILTSSDGLSWIYRSTNNESLNAVTYGNGVFVVVGNLGTILTSTDGAEWTARDSGTTYWIDIISYGNGTFVAIDGIGTILNSVDGITWTANVSEDTKSLYDITYYNGTFMAVGEFGTILTSPDGLSWTSRDSGIDSDFSGVTYGNGIFVVVGHTGLSTSADGISWTSRSSGTTHTLHNVTYGNDTFVAVGAYGTTIVTSPDGITWTFRNSGAAEDIAAVTYANDIFVALAGNTRNRILTSPDGIEWTTRYSGTDICFIVVTYGNGTFLAMGSNGKIATSPNGVEWTIRDSGITDQLHGVTFGNGTFVAVSELGTIFTSPDGVSWTSRKSGTSHALYDIAYGNGIFVAVGNNVVSTSPDGSVWKSVLLSSDASRFPTYPRLHKVIFADSIFVSLGVIIHYGPTPGSTTFRTAIFSSADGVSWTNKSFSSIYLYDYPYALGSALNGIAYGNNTIVAVGRDGTIIQSDPLQ